MSSYEETLLLEYVALVQEAEILAKRQGVCKAKLLDCVGVKEGTYLVGEVLVEVDRGYDEDGEQPTIAFTVKADKVTVVKKPH